MDEILKFAEAVGNLGVMVICSAVLIWIMVKMFVSQKKIMETLTESLAHKDRRTKEHPGEEDAEVLDLINNKIHNELSVLQQELNCDRTYSFLYHNGGISSSGLFFQRMSCISEVVAPGILPMSNTSQSIHRSSYSKICSSIQDCNEWFVEDTGVLKEEDGFLYQRFLETRAESVYIRALRSRQGNVIGFVGVDYCSLRYTEEVDLIRDRLKKSSNVLSTLVDIRGEVGGPVEENIK